MRQRWLGISISPLWWMPLSMRLKMLVIGYFRGRSCAPSWMWRFVPSFRLAMRCCVLWSALSGQVGIWI